MSAGLILRWGSLSRNQLKEYSVWRKWKKLKEGIEGEGGLGLWRSCVYALQNTTHLQRPSSSKYKRKTVCFRLFLSFPFSFLLISSLSHTLIHKLTDYTASNSQSHTTRLNTQAQVETSTTLADIYPTTSKRTNTHIYIPWQ